MKIRDVRKVFPAEIRREGADTLIKRWFIPSDYEWTDPFLLFDETKCDQAEDFAGGFPTHPHRGFEALTYMLSGTLRHRSSAASVDYIKSGGAQWLTNARGLIHDEVPVVSEELFWCLQLWINLPADNKHDEPFYASVPEDSVQSVPMECGGQVRVIAGEFEGAIGPLPPKPRPSNPFYFDVILSAESEFRYSPPDRFNVMVFVAEGAVNVGRQQVEVQEGETAVLEIDGEIQIRTTRPARVLIFGGLPISEQICWHGPFVMNTQDEINKAFEDYAAFGPFRADTGSGKDVREVSQ